MPALQRHLFRIFGESCFWLRQPVFSLRFVHRRKRQKQGRSSSRWQARAGRSVCAWAFREPNKNCKLTKLMIFCKDDVFDGLPVLLFVVSRPRNLPRLRAGHAAVCAWAGTCKLHGCAPISRQPKAASGSGTVSVLICHPTIPTKPSLVMRPLWLSKVTNLGEWLVAWPNLV